jgi:Rad3-related DNA helicase
MSIKSDLNKFISRPDQEETLNFIKKTKNDKPNTKFFLLNLPPGVGKSHLAVMISDWYTTQIDRTSKVDIITAGKILQDQYDDTYESIKNLKGKENYSCGQYACPCAQGKEFNKLNKTKCEDCPYDYAKNSFIGGKVSLTNFHLYLIYSVYSRTLLDQRSAKLLIVDECHELEDVMSDFVSIRMTENTIKKYKFGNESEILNNFRKVSNITNYVEFLKYIHQEIIRNIESVEAAMSDTDRPKKQDKRDLRLSNVLGTGPSGDIKLMQMISDMKQFQLKVEIFLKEYLENQHNWVLETTRNEKTGQTELSMEPIWASDYLDKYVWSQYDMVVMMSGTILDRNIFSDLNGFDVDRSVYYSIASPFPKENRPIYYMPLGKMSYTKKEDTFKNYVPYLHKLFKKYEMKKGIIHTNSFEISRWIEKDVSNGRLVFHDSSNKEERLRHHLESKDPTIFVSPSVGTGVSFDHEKSRFQIISKIPYPSLSSQKNKLRQKNNPDWYAWKTCALLIQMAGRSIRSKTDFADTIILDGSFSDILRYSSKFIPDWFQEAIKKIEVKTTT